MSKSINYYLTTQGRKEQSNKRTREHKLIPNKSKSGRKHRHPTCGETIEQTCIRSSANDNQRQNIHEFEHWIKLKKIALVPESLLN